MTKINNLSWIKFSIDNAGIEQILLLDSIHSNAVSVWMRAFAIIKIYGGNMELKPLLRSLTGHNISRKKVIEILEATGDFNIDKEADAIGFSDAALGKMTNASSGKNSLANALAQENFPKQTASNAHAIEKEKENRETKKQIKEGKPLPPLAEMAADKQNREQQHQKEVLSDANYNPSPELLSKVPERIRRFSDQSWYPFVCWLYDEQGTERWLEALAMQLGDAEFFDLIRRHWSETVTSFVEHSYSYGSLTRIDSKSILQQRFSLYLRPDRMPARKLKAWLRWIELRAASTDPRVQRYYDYMSEHCPNLIRMERTLTFEQFDQLRRQYGKQAVLDVLRDMENDISHVYRSCFDTALKWLRHRHKS